MSRVDDADRPRQLGSLAELDQALALIRVEFAYMDGVIDPPSSIHALRRDDLIGPEVWGIGDPLRACVVLTARPESLYLGKLAVAGTCRGQGLSRHLVELACARAGALGLPAVELQVRVELTGNLAAFAAMGFVETGRSAHPGYGRPTSVTMRRQV